MDVDGVSDRYKFRFFDASFVIKLSIVFEEVDYSILVSNTIAVRIRL